MTVCKVSEFLILQMHMYQQISVLIFSSLVISGRDLKQVEYVCADIKDTASLNSMCQQGKLILNLVGPVSTSHLFLCIIASAN